MRFRPCIDLHDGKVKQIIGSTLQDNAAKPKTNFVASQTAAYFAELYRKDNLTGGHVIMLGPGNDAAARQALAAWPGGLQLGGGITPDNAAFWLAAGAQKLIVTSYLFVDHEFSLERLKSLGEVLPPEKLVLDLSCRKHGSDYFVASQRWQNLTSLALHSETFAELGQFCSEFLIHAVEFEGKQSGFDVELVTLLSSSCPLPVTYAGGIRSLADLSALNHLGQGRVDFTVGSALDLFGGNLLKYEDLRQYKHD